MRLTQRNLDGSRSLAEESGDFTKANFPMSYRACGTGWRMAALTLLTGMFLSWRCHGAIEWVGRLEDFRTGEPLAGFPVMAGDAANAARTGVRLTDASGLFRLEYPEDYHLPNKSFYQLIASPPESEGAGTWFQHSRIDRARPSFTKIGMLPVKGFIRGIVRSLATGEPIPSAKVEAQFPTEYHNLAIVSSGTDAAGRFEIQAMAYDSDSRPNYLDGIPPEAVDPMVQFFGPSPRPRKDVVLVVRAAGFQEFDTRSRYFIPMLSCQVADLIHTAVEIGLPTVDSATTATFRAAIDDSGLLKRWMSRFLIPEALEDPGIAGPNADPDQDGVVNRVECAYLSNPADRKSVPIDLLTVRRENQTVRVDSRRQLIYRLERSGSLGETAVWSYISEFAGDDQFHEVPLEPSTAGTAFYRLAVSPAAAAAFSTFTSASSTSTAKR
ncbi:MAG: hypothetical protein JNK85_05770 [Verrucomicrobiales bacterium]|nr:hypothetical protein [Verrucomicrobiales bacterium]